MRVRIPFTKVDLPASRLSDWYTIIGAAYAGAAMIFAWFARMTEYGWPAAILIGVALASFVLIAIALGLIAWRYFHRGRGGSVYCDFFPNRAALQTSHSNLAKRFQGITTVYAMWPVGAKFYDDDENVEVIKKLLLPDPAGDAIKYLSETVERSKTVELIKEATARAKAHGAEVRWCKNFMYHSIILADTHKPDGWMHVESVLPYSKPLRRPSYTVSNQQSAEAVAEMRRVFERIWEEEGPNV